MRPAALTIGLFLFASACGDEEVPPNPDAATDAMADGAWVDSPATDSAGDTWLTPTDASDYGDARTDGAPVHGPVDLRFDGVVPIKAFVQNKKLAVVLDRPLDLRTEVGLPSRSIRWMEAEGHVIRSHGSSGMRYLLDAAMHPSGQFTLLFATKTGYSVERTDNAGQVLGVWDVQDPLIDTDLPLVPPPAGPITRATYDTGRVAAQDEVAVLATRTGRNSVVAYRLSYNDDGAFSVLSRAVVVPPVSIAPIGLNGGSYDTFGLVNAQYAVHLAVGPDAFIYVGVRYPDISSAALLKAHKSVFDETLVGDPDALDSYVTRLSATGERLGTSVVTTPGPDELQTLRPVTGGVYVGGRTEHWNAQGTGFDVIVAHISASTGMVNTRELDVDAGDVAFDVAPIDGSALLVVGASGYTQNPHGASVSEPSQGFARVWSTAGQTKAIQLPQGPRHNEARLVVEYGAGQFLIGGMIDGPGTHSADADSNLLRASGYLVSVAVTK